MKDAGCGLLLKTYQSDIFNNWIKTEWVDGENGISAITAISTAGDKFTIDQLNLSKKVYDMLNRIAVSGGTYQDWVETVYTSEWNMHTETPMYEGGMSSEIEFQEVVSNSATADELKSWQGLPLPIKSIVLQSISHSRQFLISPTCITSGK